LTSPECTAIKSGRPTESIIDKPPTARTGWLRAPEASVWAVMLNEIALLLEASERSSMADRAQVRARKHFGMDVITLKLEKALVKAAEMGPVPALGMRGSARSLRVLV
jgi:alpha-1,3/alpha-1,6-mannosyltransferase